MDRIHTSRSLADQALSNLVNQFARPLDFLRELVQNSLDAGTPRVEVRVELHSEAETADRPVVAIHVDDFGEGMDEAIIDEQLTRLFSSNKEDDLTKIGKFGIGFTSIFAIRPEAVLVHTGRHGEFWELLFHEDRTFEKVKVDTPVSGTRITLFKTMSATEVPTFVEEARFVLSYWCEHSQTPILFEDRTDGSAATPVRSTDDPFAAFAEPASSTPMTAVNSPFSLPDAVLFAESRQAETEVLVGLGASPRYGFYNGGLTLVNSTNRDVLGAFEDRLGHLCIKVRSDQLEHTLTRDNVLRDAEWERVMQQVVHTADSMRQSLLDAVEHACKAGEDLGVWHGHLTLEVAQIKGRSHPFIKAVLGRLLFRGHDGPVSLIQIERQERKLGRLLLHPGDGPLATALHATRTLLVRGDEPTRRLLDALPSPMRLGLIPVRRSIVNASDRFLLPRLLPAEDLSTQEHQLLQATQALVSAATQGRGTLAMGELVGPGTSKELMVEGPRDGALFERKSDGWLWLPSFLRWRTLLLNRSHEHVRMLVAISSTSPQIAATALAQAVLDYEGIEGAQAFQRLLNAAAEEVV